MEEQIKKGRISFRGLMLAFMLPCHRFRFESKLFFPTTSVLKFMIVSSGVNLLFIFHVKLNGNKTFLSPWISISIRNKTLWNFITFVVTEGRETGREKIERTIKKLNGLMSISFVCLFVYRFKKWHVGGG